MVDLVNTGTENAPIYDWTVIDRHYTLTPSTFTKRQLYPHEQILNNRGGVAQYAFNPERLENERYALEFIAKNTKIPVPRVLGWSHVDGVRCLTVETLDGAMLGDLLRDGDNRLNSTEKAILKANAIAYVYDTVLPELRKLRSRTLGQLSGAVFPPPRVSDFDGRPFWQPKVSTTERYVYCHNDLAWRNIVVDPKTLEVISIIDWEFSGFFPPEFEKPLWLEPDANGGNDEEECRGLVALLDESIHAEILLKSYFLLGLVGQKPQLSDTLHRVLAFQDCMVIAAEAVSPSDGASRAAAPPTIF
ncbi:hypothetical protein MMC09_001622 [Bachmanniomyces sp. S44760]|nr:hypothetical protein [Bachmanniomyces sp. S44760]